MVVVSVKLNSCYEKNIVELQKGVTWSILPNNILQVYDINGGVVASFDDWLHVEAK
jgi:hypothetical protein